MAHETYKATEYLRRRWTLDPCWWEDVEGEQLSLAQQFLNNTTLESWSNA